jgi:excisionase family DNA binding protein
MNRPRAKKYITSLEEVPLMVDVPYVAELLQLNIRTVRNYCRNGNIKATKFGKDWRIPKSEIERMYEGGVIA